MDETSTNTSSSSDDLTDPKYNWLQRTPIDFLSRRATLDSDETINKEARLVYDKLTLHLCFFVDGKLQLFSKQSTFESRDNGLLCVPCEVVEVDVDENALRRPEQNVSLHDLALSMLQDEIRSGIIRTVQFLDFAYDEPVILRRSDQGRMKGDWEHRELDVAVILSLDPASFVGPYRTMTFPMIARSPVHYQMESLPLTEQQAKAQLARGLLSDVFTPTALSRLFQRYAEICSEENMTTLHKYYRSNWREVLCARRISSAISIWKAYNLLPHDQPACGLVTHPRKQKDKISLFVFDAKDYEKNKHREELGRDLGDGLGRRAFTVVGSIAVGDFVKGDCTMFTDWDDEDLFGLFVGEDGRLQVEIVDRWNH